MIFPEIYIFGGNTMENISVIVADASAEFCERTALLLREKGFNVLATATDGNHLLQCIEAHQPQVVLLDLALPSIDGFQVIRESEKLNLPTPPAFIILTSFQLYIDFIIFLCYTQPVKINFIGICRTAKTDEGP